MDFDSCSPSNRPAWTGQAQCLIRLSLSMCHIACSNHVLCSQGVDLWGNYAIVDCTLHATMQAMYEMRT